MFGMLLIASLFEGTITNQQFNHSDAYSLPTKRQKLYKTRFFVGWTTFYTLILLGLAMAVAGGWLEPVLSLLPFDEVHKFHAWLHPAAERVVHVFNASYYREFMLLLTLLCYDQDAQTSISMAVVISFLPTLAICLARHILFVVQNDNLVALPDYMMLDDATFQSANYACLLAAHCIMYLSWVKTLRGWFVEQNLFKMRYDILAEKYQREVAEAAASPKLPSAPTHPVSAPLPLQTSPMAPSEAIQPVQDSTDSGASPNEGRPLIRKLSSDYKPDLAPARLGHLPGARKSVQDLVSGSLISLDARGQSIDSTSSVSVAQQKIGTPTIVPIDDGLECFSYVGKTFALWDLQRIAVKRTFVGHTQPVSKLKPIIMKDVEPRRLHGSQNECVNVIISASWDGTVKMWNVETGECLATLECKIGGITSINTFDNDTKLIVGSAQGLVSLWDLQTKTIIGEIYEQTAVTVSAVGVWEDQSKFFAASFDGTVYIWNLGTKRCEKKLRKHTKRIVDAVMYDSDTRLITVSEDKLGLIWDLEQGTLLRTLEGHSAPVQVVIVYGESQRAITGSTDGQIIAWDICTEDIGQLIVSSLDDHTASIISIHVFEGDLNKMYTHSMDRKLRVWDMAANICERVIDMPPTNADLELQRAEPSTRLRVCVAWNPADGLALDSAVQFIQAQGHLPTACKSANELMSHLSSPAFEDHFIILDLSLPQLKEINAADLVRRVNDSGARIVLLTTAELSTLKNADGQLPELFQSVHGFLELTEKPLTELYLAKMLDEVADSTLEDATGSDSVLSSASSSGRTGRNGPSSSSPNQGNSTNSLSNAAITRYGTPYPNASTGRKGSADVSESALHSLRERLSYVESLFACFVPVQFFELISPKGRDRTQLGDAVCKSVTVLFSDIRDFSSMSETMAVSELMEFLNAYLAFAMPPIQENGGFVDKFIGDSIMALFSQDGTQQCISAVNCAISMMSHLDGLQDNGFTQVATGIGINTGRMIIGLVGVETRMEPTVLGDAVNLASRLESLCKVYDSRVIISQYTREKLGRSAELYTLRELDLVVVKGKRLACKIYEILEADRAESQKGKRLLLRDGLWDSALATYRDGNWETALSLFEQCLQIWPLDKPSKLYVERCKSAITSGTDPRKWDSTNRLAYK